MWLWPLGSFSCNPFVKARSTASDKAASACDWHLRWRSQRCDSIEVWKYENLFVWGHLFCLRDGRYHFQTSLHLQRNGQSSHNDALVNEKVRLSILSIQSGKSSCTFIIQCLVATFRYNEMHLLHHLTAFPPPPKNKTKTCRVSDVRWLASAAVCRKIFFLWLCCCLHFLSQQQPSYGESDE